MELCEKLGLVRSEKKQAKDPLFVEFLCFASFYLDTTYIRRHYISANNMKHIYDWDTIQI